MREDTTREVSLVLSPQSVRDGHGWFPVTTGGSGVSGGIRFVEGQEVDGMEVATTEPSYGGGWAIERWGMKRGVAGLVAEVGEVVEVDEWM